MPKAPVAIATNHAQRRRVIDAHKAQTAGLLMRDMLVWELHLQGMSEEAIARQDGRSAQMIHKIIARFRKDGFDGEDLLRQAPAKIIGGLLRRSQLAWRYAAQCAIDADSTRDRTAAVKAMMDADERVQAILQTTGYMPNDLGTMRHLVDVRAVALTMIDAVRALESGEKTPEQVRGVFEGLLDETGDETIEIEAA